jgi:5-hydroxyisourate hydrolase
MLSRRASRWSLLQWESPMNRTCLLLSLSWVVVPSLPAGGGAEGPARSPITVHVLDSSRGKPAAGLTIVLEQAEGKEWRKVATAKTDENGRIEKLLPADKPVAAGTYRLTFDSGAYFAESKTKTFYPQIVVIFEIDNPKEHYHVPLILSPFGYSTYRGG